jgi:hypothetical protein
MSNLCFLSRHSNHVCHSDMYLQPGLKEPTLNIALNSRAHRSPFPPNSTNLTHGTTTFNQLGGSSHGRNGPFLSQSTGPATESSVSFTFPDEGGNSYLSSSSGDYSMVGWYLCVFICTTDDK